MEKVHIRSRGFRALARHSLRAFIIVVFLCGSLEYSSAQGEQGKAEAVMGFDNLRPGLCVYIGGENADILAEIADGGRYHVHALTSDSGRLKEFRESIASKGLYGQVVADQSALSSLPYPDNLVNLLIVEDLGGLRERGLTVAELMRAVAPYGSLVVKNAPGDMAQFVKEAGYDALISRQEVWTQVVKPWPDAMDDWPQHSYDAGFSATSSDQVLRVPDSVQWIAGDAWRHESSPISVISTDGRIFSSYSDQGIVARDAFNGTKLWQRKAEPALIVTKDRLFARLEKLGPIAALDPITGETIKVYSFGAADKAWPPLSLLAYADGVLLSGKRGIIEAYDAESGEQIWTKKVPGESGGGSKAFDKIALNRRIIGDGKVFLTLVETEELLCLDLKTGEEVWRVPSQGSQLVCYRQGRLFAGGKKGGYEVFNSAISPEDGKRLWQYDYRRVYHGGGPFKMFFVDGLVWVLVSQAEEGLRYSKEAQVWHGLNPDSGEVEKRIEWPKTKLHCYGDVATERYIIAGGMDLLDTREGEGSRFLGGRGSCTFGRMPANGLLYQTPNVCQCYNQVRGVVAFTANARAAETSGTMQANERIVRGPGKPADERPAYGDWSMFRHDAQRSGSTTATLSSDLKAAWEKNFGSRLSSPVIACGKVFISSIDEHRVIALDQGTGAAVWSYRANGRVDSPPTVYDGMVLFGDRDGWVYCLSSATGEMIWSLDAAGGQRWLMNRGQVESAWPIFGSVLIDNDTAYFSAGLHTHVDGGIRLYAVKAETGEIVWRKDLNVNSLYTGQNVIPSISNDVLTSNGKSLFIQKQGIDPETGEVVKKSAPFWSGTGGDFLTDIVQRIVGWHDLNFRNWRISTPSGDWNARITGLTLCFDESNAYGVRTFGDERKPWIVKGYEVFMCDRKKGIKDGIAWKVALAEGKLPKAILLADDKLFVAVVEEEDGPDNGALLIFNPADGQSMKEIALNLAPKFDGLAAVKDSLIIVGQNGKATCLIKE